MQNIIRRPLLLLPAILIALTFFPLPAHAEVIRSFDVHAKVLKNASIDVTETITIDFGKQSRHGIERVFGTSQSVSLLSVVDKHNQKYETSLSNSEGKTKLRIGSATKFVTGSNLYRIHYKLGGGALDSHGHLDWSPTGHNWTQCIERFNLRLTSEVPLPGVLPTALLGTHKLVATKIDKGHGYQIVAHDVLPGQGVDLKGNFGAHFTKQPDTPSSIATLPHSAGASNALLPAQPMPMWLLVSVGVGLFAIIGTVINGATSAFKSVQFHPCGCRGNSQNCRCVSSCSCVKQHGWMTPQSTSRGAAYSAGAFGNSSRYDNDIDTDWGSDWSSSSSSDSGSSSSDSGASGSDGGGGSW